VFRLFSGLVFSRSFLFGSVSSSFNFEMFFFAFLSLFLFCFFFFFFFKVFRWVEGHPVADAAGRPARFF
jgi:hypothetical protein